MKRDEISGPDGNGGMMVKDYVCLLEKMLFIMEACEIFDEISAKAAIIGLRQKTWQYPIGELLYTMDLYLRNGDFEKASRVAERIIETTADYACRLNEMIMGNEVP